MPQLIIPVLTFIASPAGQALAGAAAGVAGSLEAQAAGERQQAQSREATAEKRRAVSQANSILEKAKEELGKGFDEIISDAEAGDLRRRGILSDTEEAFITELNKTEEGQLETINRAREATRSVGEEVIQDFAQAGLITRETLEGSQGEAIANFLPFQETGQRALNRLKVLTGLATDAEKSAFEAEFGTIEETPTFQFRREQLEKQISRRQRAAGRTFSGVGFQRFQEEVDQLAAQETEAQIQRSAGLAQLGLTASQQIAGIQERGGLDRARFAIQQAQLTGASRERFIQLQNQISQQELQARGQLGGARAAGIQQLGLSAAKFTAQRNLAQAQLSQQQAQGVQSLGVSGQSFLGPTDQQPALPQPTGTQQALIGGQGNPFNGGLGLGGFGG